MYERLQEYTKIRCGTWATIQVKFLCNNEGIVKTINKLRRHPITPKFFYSPDADIIQEILLLIRMLNKNGDTVKIRHIKIGIQAHYRMMPP
jgi:hypothetical protein